MLPHLRTYYNKNFTEQKYRLFLKRLDAVCGMNIEFRISETPVFIPPTLMHAMVDAGRDIILQLVNNPHYHAQAQHAIPVEFNVPHETPHPLFVAVDFGIVQQADGTRVPRLIELQGFPTLFAFQPMQAILFRETFGLPRECRFLLGDLDFEEYLMIFRRAVLGTHDPEHVVLMELDPEKQKTRPDFLLTERFCGIRTVNIRDVVKQGRLLFYQRDGKRTPIFRIYNRAIADELIRTGAQLPFSFRDELDVEWAGHPNWFFRLSKFSLPFIHHALVPRTFFLHEMTTPPDDLENWVLKPLFSFAGSGVIIGPTRAQLDAVPQEQRQNYVLQEKVEYGSFVDTPYGGTKAEVRIMFIWNDELTPVTNLVRMGRGKMMGVDHNKNMAWVGSSAGFYLP